MTPPLFLSPAELIDLTGRKLQAGQRKWLKDAGYAFALNANGRPIVARDYALARLGVATAATSETQRAAAPRPNFAALAAR